MNGAHADVVLLARIDRAHAEVARVDRLRRSTSCGSSCFSSLQRRRARVHVFPSIDVVEGDAVAREVRSPTRRADALDARRRERASRRASRPARRAPRSRSCRANAVDGVHRGVLEVSLAGARDDRGAVGEIQRDCRRRCRASVATASLVRLSRLAARRARARPSCTRAARSRGRSSDDGEAAHAR